MQLRGPTKKLLEIVRWWRNSDISGLRTPFMLTKEMQESFYEGVLCDRDSRHRYWGFYQGDSYVAFGGVTNISWENRLVGGRIPSWVFSRR